MKQKLAVMILSLLLLTPFALAQEEIQEEKPLTQEAIVEDSYLTKAHIQTNSKTELQTIIIKKSFLVWVTIRKGKDITPTTDNTK